MDMTRFQPPIYESTDSMHRNHAQRGPFVIFLGTWRGTVRVQIRALQIDTGTKKETLPQRDIQTKSDCLGSVSTSWMTKPKALRNFFHPSVATEIRRVVSVHELEDEMKVKSIWNHKFRRKTLNKNRTSGNNSNIFGVGATSSGHKERAAESPGPSPGHHPHHPQPACLMESLRLFDYLKVDVNPGLHHSPKREQTPRLKSTLEWSRNGTLPKSVVRMRQTITLTELIYDHPCH